MKFLFFSPHSLADSCSGAARSVHTLLEELVAQGHPCLVVTGAVVDGRSQLFEQILAMPAGPSFNIGGTDIKIPMRRVKIRTVDHIILGAKGLKGRDLMAYEEVVLRTLFVDTFESFQPDVLISYGGFTSNFFAGQYALMHGRRSVLFAASDTYNKPSDFVHVNMVTPVSKALGQRLTRVTKLPMVVLSSMVRKADILCENRTPEFITFINPTLAKGLKLVVAMALECQRREKPYKFLFVESRGTKATARQECPEMDACKNVSFVKNTADIVGVYKRTRIIVFPSLWYETAGRVAIEANANGIPVLASNVGGIPEMLDDAGYLFAPPQEMIDQWGTQPPAAYVEKWLTVLDRLHDDPAEHDDAVKRAQAADGRYNLPALAQKFAAAVMR